VWHKGFDISPHAPLGMHQTCNFSTHASACRSMCLYIQNQDFERYTENMLDRLAEGAGYAREQLTSLARATGQLGKDAAGLQAKTAEALELLQQQRELEEVRHVLAVSGQPEILLSLKGTRHEEGVKCVNACQTVQ
jgi:hypothetical protein